MKPDQSLLWLEQNLFRLHRKKTYLLLLLCFVIGLLVIGFNLLKGEQVLALLWILLTMDCGIKIALSCMDNTLKHIIALKGDILHIIVNKMILPIYRNEVFILLFALATYVMLTVKHVVTISFFLRVAVCLIGIPIVVFFTVTTYLVLRGFTRTLIHIFTVAAFNVFFVAEQITMLTYLVETVFIVVLFLVSKMMVSKLAYETLLKQGE